MKDEETHETQEPSRGTIIALVIVCVLGLGAFCFYFYLPMPEISSEQARKNQLKDEEMLEAWTRSKKFVMKRLKCPSTAKFAIDWKEDPDTHILDWPGGEYSVRGWVDSQNSYGAMIRTKFHLKLRKNWDGYWTILEGPTFD